MEIKTGFGFVLPINMCCFKYNDGIYIIGDTKSYKDGFAKVITMNSKEMMISKGHYEDFWYSYEVEKNENKIPDFNDIIAYLKEESINKSVYSLDYSLNQLREEGLSEEEIKTVVNNLLSKYVQGTENNKEDIEMEEENTKTTKK